MGYDEEHFIVQTFPNAPLHNNAPDSYLKIVKDRLPGDPNRWSTQLPSYNQAGLIWIAHSSVAWRLGSPSHDRPAGSYPLRMAL